VFLDPPFASRELLSDAATRLDAGGWLSRGTVVYVESAARESLPALPAAWKPLKSGRAGEVGYHLFERPAPGERSE
jgi:16S rRNA (guanine966-N2)-methyltransferase